MPLGKGLENSGDLIILFQFSKFYIGRTWQLVLGTVKMSSLE
jgi:hypothetical protein